MGAVAEGALRAGGKVTGIIPRFLINKEATETALDRLDELVITDNMHERKHRMFEKSDAFVALPGGIGTVEEIVEIMTWAQLGHHRKPIVFANVKGFWDPMLALLDHMSSRRLHSHRAAGEAACGRRPGSDRRRHHGDGIVRRCADRRHAVGDRQALRLSRNRHTEPGSAVLGIAVELRPRGAVSKLRAGRSDMNIAPNAEGTDLSPYLPDEHGLFFIYHFTADGVRTKDAAQARWTWRSYQITDMHARQEIAAEKALPPAGARAFLAAQPWLPHRPRGWLALRRSAGPQARLFGGTRARPFPLRLQRHHADRRPQAAAGVGRRRPQGGGERVAEIPLAAGTDRGGHGPVARRHGGRARQTRRRARRHRGPHRVRCMAQ